MDKETRRALEVEGFRFGDAADFLELTEEERMLVELRVSLARAVRRRRELAKLSQKQVATRIKSSQPRVAKIEAASADVSLDLMFRGLFAVGGNMDDLTAPSPRRRASPVSVKPSIPPSPARAPRDLEAHRVRRRKGKSPGNPAEV